jgi:translation initiation factor IF-2
MAWGARQAFRQRPLGPRAFCPGRGCRGGKWRSPSFWLRRKLQPPGRLRPAGAEARAKQAFSPRGKAPRRLGRGAAPAPARGLAAQGRPGGKKGGPGSPEKTPLRGRPASAPWGARLLGGPAPPRPRASPERPRQALFGAIIWSAGDSRLPPPTGGSAGGPRPPAATGGGAESLGPSPGPGPPVKIKKSSAF